EEFFDLRAYAAALRDRHSPAQLRALRDDTLEPALAVQWGPGFGPLRQTADATWRTVGPSARLGVANRRTLRPGTFVATLRTAVPARVTLRYPSGVEQQVVVTPRPMTVRRVLQLRPGMSTIRITAAPLDPRVAPSRLGLIAQDPGMLESGFVPF